MSAWVRGLQAERDAFRATLHDRQASKEPNEDPGWGGLDAFSRMEHARTRRHPAAAC